MPSLLRKRVSLPENRQRIKKTNGTFSFFKCPFVTDVSVFCAPVVSPHQEIGTSLRAMKRSRRTSTEFSTDLASTKGVGETSLDPAQVLEQKTRSGVTRPAVNTKKRESTAFIQTKQKKTKQA